MPNGLRKVVVNNVAELDVLLMQSQKCAAEVAHNVSARKRLDIIKRSKELNIKVTNAHARIIVTESQ